MGAVATAAGTLDTDIATFATDLATFIAAIATSRASLRSATNSSGPQVEENWGAAIMSAMLVNTAVRQLFAACDLRELDAKFSRGGKAGSANPAVTLATVFAAV